MKRPGRPVDSKHKLPKWTLPPREPSSSTSSSIINNKIIGAIRSGKKATSTKRSLESDGAASSSIAGRGPSLRKRKLRLTRQSAEDASSSDARRRLDDVHHRSMAVFATPVPLRSELLCRDAGDVRRSSTRLVQGEAVLETNVLLLVASQLVSDMQSFLALGYTCKRFAAVLMTTTRESEGLWRAVYLKTIPSGQPERTQSPEEPFNPTASVPPHWLADVGYQPASWEACTFGPDEDVGDPLVLPFGMHWKTAVRMKHCVAQYRYGARVPPRRLQMALATCFAIEGDRCCLSRLVHYPGAHEARAAFLRDFEATCVRPAFNLTLDTQSYWPLPMWRQISGYVMIESAPDTQDQYPWNRAGSMFGPHITGGSYKAAVAAMLRLGADIDFIFGLEERPPGLSATCWSGNGGKLSPDRVIDVCSPSCPPNVATHYTRWFLLRNSSRKVTPDVGGHAIACGYSENPVENMIAAVILAFPHCVAPEPAPIRFGQVGEEMEHTGVCLLRVGWSEYDSPPDVLDLSSFSALQRGAGMLDMPLQKFIDVISLAGFPDIAQGWVERHVHQRVPLEPSVPVPSSIITFGHVDDRECSQPGLDKPSRLIDDAASLSLDLDLGVEDEHVEPALVIPSAHLSSGSSDMGQLPRGSRWRLAEPARVVNVKVQHIRPKHKDLKGWCEDSNNVYIGRAGVVFIEGTNGTKRRYPPRASIFANPFKVGTDRDGAIEKYRRYIHTKLETGAITQSDLDSLRGKQLGCWCSPAPCHGDVLVDILRLSKHPTGPENHHRARLSESKTMEAKRTKVPVACCIPTYRPHDDVEHCLDDEEQSEFDEISITSCATSIAHSALPLY